MKLTCTTCCIRRISYSTNTVQINYKKCFQLFSFTLLNYGLYTPSPLLRYNTIGFSKLKERLKYACTLVNLFVLTEQLALPTKKNLHVERLSSQSSLPCMKTSPCHTFLLKGLHTSEWHSHGFETLETKCLPFRHHFSIVNCPILVQCAPTSFRPTVAWNFGFLQWKLVVICELFSRRNGTFGINNDMLMAICCNNLCVTVGFT